VAESQRRQKLTTVNRGVIVHTSCADWAALTLGPFLRLWATVENRALDIYTRYLTRAGALTRAAIRLPMITHVVPVAVFVSTTMTSGATLALVYVLVCRRAWRGLALDGAALNCI
jgi:hypothetical protein